MITSIIKHRQRGTVTLETVLAIPVLLVFVGSAWTLVQVTLLKQQNVAALRTTAWSHALHGTPCRQPARPGSGGYYGASGDCSELPVTDAFTAILTAEADTLPATQVITAIGAYQAGVVLQPFAFDDVYALGSLPDPFSQPYYFNQPGSPAAQIFP